MSWILNITDVLKYYIGNLFLFQNECNSFLYFLRSEMKFSCLVVKSLLSVSQVSLLVEALPDNWRIKLKDLEEPYGC